MRRLITAVVVTAMMLLPGCGRQVTGLDLPSGAIVPDGQTLIRFETAGPLDFQNITYLIVFNTSGDDLQPFAQGLNSDFKSWSAFFVVGGGSGFANFPGLLQGFQDPASGTPRSIQIIIPTGTVSFQTTIPNANAQFGFQIQFNRCLLDLLPPSATAQPPPTVGRSCPPFQHIGTTWNVSLFTLDRNGANPIDSLGVNGPADTSYKFDFDTATTFTKNTFKPSSGSTVSNPSARITGIEVFSTAINAVSAPSPTPAPAGP